MLTLNYSHFISVSICVFTGYILNEKIGSRLAFVLRGVCAAQHTFKKL